MTIRAALAAAAARLVSAAHDAHTARWDAELLLRFVAQRDRAWLLAHHDDVLTVAQQAAYEALIERRLRHEPVQYIIGEQEFYGLGLHVTPAVLIPRPETEHLVEAVLARVPNDHPLHIADVGTGSGAIAIALAHALPLAQLDALDLSVAALEVAQRNARRHGLDGRMRFLHSDLLAAVQGKSFDCIVSNPPYVPATEVLEPQVVQWEPHSALFAGSEGLDIYQRLLPQARALLRRGGLFAIEIGAGQQPAIEALFRQDAAWTTPEFLPDLQGIARVAIARAR
ncbi:peptide chain release factor N(5)-glutamine methyltransferase [Acidipila sp. EB88]|uniref:peptide chain release factor N(5)-glutamine methyltransferase n=1 Tax=Acidipila sp. EB88 TaxID=2305226 RepID=UPI000F5FBD66|nr:peptide chain release factor N(5)-glutamine methyltransferase [Acidipila sp. EB88]RRA48006.1 peptide chain release factor N(5)-glutamine methyltransferase [Acidipila sp. EB88]